MAKSPCFPTLHGDFTSERVGSTTRRLHQRVRLAILYGIDPWYIFSIARGEELRPFSTCVRRCRTRSSKRSASFAFRRSSALLAAYPGPSSLSSSPRARTSLLTPTAIICHPVISLLRSTLSSNTRASTDDAGAGVPFGCIVTSDNWISTGSSSSESSSPSSFRSALRSVRSVWLTLHAVNRRFIHPIFFSRSSARALVLSLITHSLL